MPAKKPRKPAKKKPKPSDQLPPEEHAAAFMDAVRRAVNTPKPKGGWKGK
jgi:hypothetical protein